LISGFGKIVRDEKGNVVDIILPEDDDQETQEAEVDEDEDEENAANPIKPVQAKTEVVKSKP
jgi:nucleolar protein 16